MDPLTSIFILALYKATEKVWEKGFDAAWEPVGTGLKDRFLHLAGKGQERERRAAFAVAAQTARALTVRQAASPQQAERVLDALDGKLDKRVAQAFAQEAAKLMLFSAVPDVPRLSSLCRRTLNFEALSSNEPPPPAETVAAVLSDYLTNLREALLDQEPYHDLVQHDMRRALNDILAELRPLDYDDEATYRAQMAEMYRELEFVGIPELKQRRPITIEDIFLRLRAEREEQGGMPGSDEIAVNDALREARRLVILGDPGAGKTTLLKYLTVVCAEGRAETEIGLKAEDGTAILPVFILLREFAAEATARHHDYSLLDYLYTHAHERLILNMSHSFFEDALKHGRCLVCLDGLDEIWSMGQRKMVCDLVKALVNHFPANNYIITSRIVGYEEVPLDRRDFVHHTVLPLTNDDIREFVRRWYELRERDPMQRKRQADDLITTIEREPRIQPLARNPLLLTIIALVHRIEAELPHERVKLYDKCVTALVQTWEEVKGLTIAEKQRPFYRYQRRLLERLAYELHTSIERPGQVQMIKEGNLELLLTRFMIEDRRVELTDVDSARNEARAFVQLVRGRTGLLVERGKGLFGFSHLTFQEYLAACDIERRCFGRGAESIWAVIKERLLDPYWQEVILLLLGILNKYDDLPTDLLERILAAGERDRFELVLHRHLYLAARVLADRVDVATSLRRQVVENLLVIARRAPQWEQEDAFKAFSWLIGDIFVVEGLLDIAYDLQLDPLVRHRAIMVLGDLGYIEDVVNVLLTMACNSQLEVGVRQRAAETLKQFDHAEDAMEAMLALARDLGVDIEIHLQPAKILSRFGRVANVMEMLFALARDSQVEIGVRRRAAKMLRQISYAEDAVDGLFALARDSQVEVGVRYHAAEALRHLGRTGDAIETLFALTNDPQVTADIRCKSAVTLYKLDYADDAAEILLDLAYNPQVEAKVRCQAAQALEHLGCTSDMLKILLALGRDPQVEAEVRYQSAELLGYLGRTVDMVEILLALARDPQMEAEMRRRAAEALGRLSRANDAVEVLLTLAHDPQVEAEVRRRAAEALKHLGCVEDVVEVMLVLVQDPLVETGVRSSAYRSLKQLVGNGID